MQGVTISELAHVGTSFFVDVAQALASMQRAALDLTAAPSLSAVAAAVAELDVFGVDDDTATNLGGKAFVDTHGLNNWSAALFIGYVAPRSRQHLFSG